MNSSKLKNIEPILKITKNIIKKSDNFNDYYIHKSNTLYQKQLPLLKFNSKTKEVMLLKKIKINHNTLSEEKNYKNITNDKLLNNSILPFANIRKQNIRSKKIPRLCPFYSRRGDLLPKVVSTSKISMNTFLTESNYDLNFSRSIYLKKHQVKKPLYAMSPFNFAKKNYSDYFKILEINFDEFQKEILYDEQYNNLKYENSKMFGHKEFYMDYINDLVKEIFINSNDENKSKIYEEGEVKKEKIFTWGKNKVKIKLNLSSINVKIREITNNDINININNLNNNKLEETNIFEYNLPIILLPLFYYKGFDKFKLFLVSFISFDEEKQKFIMKQNISKIINALLSNCSDLEVKKIMDEKIKDAFNLVEPIIFKKNSTINKLAQSKLIKTKSKNYSTLKTGKSIDFDQLIPKNQIFASTNVNIVSKKKYTNSKFEIFPKEKKKNDFLNYNVFQFLWNISDKTYLVSIEMPIIRFEIPDYNIIVKQYINFELLFYLFKIEFKVWDFYIVKYLSSFKIFRILISQLLSIRPKKDLCFYLEKYKTKNLENTDYKVINIATSKFLNEKINKNKKDIFEKLKLKTIEKVKEKDNENKKTDIIEEKRDIINEENKSNKEKSNELKEEKDKKEEKDNEMEFSSSNKNNMNELIPKNTNSDNLSDNRIDNLIIEQKNFIAIVTLNDSENHLSNQYKIHFNYSQFTKFKSMETYMNKIYFLLKFINIDYNKNIISFDYDSLNVFEEKDWIKEVEKYNLNYNKKISLEKHIINKEEEKLETFLNKNKIEFPGGKKGSSLSVEIKQPIILLRSIYENGKINTKVVEVLEDKENMLCLNNENNALNLSRNIYELSMYYREKEIDDKNRKDLADNILHLAIKKSMGNKN